jgi:hypothetical protein
MCVMTVRIFAIDGVPFADQQDVTCAALSCRVIAPTLDAATRALHQQIVARWTAQSADLSVLIEVRPIDLTTIPLPTMGLNTARPDRVLRTDVR